MHGSLFVALPLDYLNVGKNADILENLQINGKPAEFPALRENEMVICGSVSNEAGHEGMELLCACPSLPSMQETYDRWHMFLKNTIHWYRCTNFKELVKRLKEAKAEKSMT